jgi:hypothetical protein
MKLNKSLDSIAFGGKTYREIFIDNNLILNGDFETDVSNWTRIIGTNLTRDTTDSFKGISSARMQTLTNDTSYHFQNLNVSPTDTVYAWLHLKKVSGDTRFHRLVLVGNNSTQTFAQNNPNLLDWQRLSVLKTNATIIRIGNNQDNFIFNVLYDDINAINLTALFGAGQEPTKAQMDTLFAEFQEAGSVAVGQFEQGQGKNLFDGRLEDGGLNSSNGTTTTTADRKRTDFIPTSNFIQNQIYTLSSNGVKTSVNILYYDVNKNFISFAFDDDFTLTNTSIKFIRFFSTTSAMLLFQLELGSVSTTYEPYSYLAIHNPASNDIPIPALNNKTLNEVFVGGQLVANGDFSNGTTGWITNDGTLSVVNGNLLLSNSTSQFPRAMTTLNLSSGSVIYGITRLRDLLNNVGITGGAGISLRGTPANFSIQTTYNNNNQFQIISNKVTITNNTTELWVTNYQTSTKPSTTEIDYAYTYNLTSLGIATLTKSQLDYLYQVWQFNQVNALVARQFIQEA